MSVDRVVLAAPRGFCAGGEKSLKALDWMTRVFEPPIYCYHEIVHNQFVVDHFKSLGVNFVDDVRDVLERASARETTARVAIGSFAKQLLAPFGISVLGYVVSIGAIEAKTPGNIPLDELRRITEESQVRVADPEAERAIIAEIDAVEPVAVADRLARSGGPAATPARRLRAAGRPARGSGGRRRWGRRGGRAGRAPPRGRRRARPAQGPEANAACAPIPRARRVFACAVAIASPWSHPCKVPPRHDRRPAARVFRSDACARDGRPGLHRVKDDARELNRHEGGAAPRPFASRRPFDGRRWESPNPRGSPRR